MSILEIDAFNGSYSYTDGVTGLEPTDIYQLPLLESGNLRLALGGLSAPVALEVRDELGTLLRTVEIDASNPEAINLSDLSAGNYFLQVARTNKNTGYNLNIDTITGQQVDSGFFVSDEESMTLDILTGGNTPQEIAVVNLEGMEQFNPGSEAYIKEAARRALSNSALGRVLVSGSGNQTGLSGVFPWEREISGNFDGAPSRYAATFTAQPGDKFALMAVRNNTIQNVFDNPQVTGSKSPVFSLEEAGGAGGFAITQSELANGTTFSIDKNGNVKETVIYISKPEPEPTPPVVVPPLVDESSVVVPPVVDVGGNNLPPKVSDITAQMDPLGKSVTIAGTVSDRNGASDIERVEFLLHTAGDSWITLGTTSSFTVDAADGEQVSFNYAWTPNLDLAAGSYKVKAIAYDREGKSSNASLADLDILADLKITDPSDDSETTEKNLPPKDLNFTAQMDTVGQSVAIAGTVSDDNGARDIALVEFFLHTGGDSWTTLGTTDSFTVNAADGEQVSFNYAWTADLAAGSYKVKAIAYDRKGQPSDASFADLNIIDIPDDPETTENNLPPKVLNFTAQMDAVGKSVTIAGTVSDRNGASNIERVEFFLHTAGDSWTPLGTISSVTVDAANSETASFNYAWTPNLDLAAGSYKVKAIAYDRGGKRSNASLADLDILADLNIIDIPGTSGSTNPTDPVTPPDRLPGSPEGLDFTILPIYTNEETLSLTGGKVQDTDGTDDIDKIQFFLRTVGGEWVEFGEGKSLTAAGDGVTRFDFSHDLTGLTPGSYQLRAVAYDKAGKPSNFKERNFAIITEPGGEGLSDELRVDLAGAANLDRYNREDLAATKQSVVWVTPGRSATDLATSLGAVNLGETGQIPNTYIWEFPVPPDGQNTPEYIANRLASLPGVEFAYPNVPVPIKLMSTSSDDGYKYPQWNLQSWVNPDVPSSIADAWKIISQRTNLPVRGRDAVIGIVDDGVDYDHPEFVNRYKSGVSWDFSDGDADPFPQSNRTFSANVLDYNVRPNYVRFNLPVTLTGLVTDVTLNLKLASGLGKGQLDGLTFKLYSPSDQAKEPFDWLSYAGLWWRYPGWHDVNGSKYTGFTPKPSMKAGESFSMENDFDGIYAGGTWQLEVSFDPYYKSYNPENIAKSLIESWSLDVETANPHGTAVTGVAGAGGNLLSGVAPESQFAALRLIGTVEAVTSTYDTPGSTIANALFQAKTAPGGVNRNNEIDIFNNSWGPEYMREFPLAIAAVESGFKRGRNGLGNVYIFSSGNDGAKIGHINYNNLANSRGAIAVGAITRDGKLAKYSTPAPFVVAYSDNATNDPDYEILTTAIVQQQQITDFGGTSAAAPFVAGVTALMLDANPNLTARDVQHIFAETAYKNDPAHSGWRVNGAGYDVNPQYGFGAVDPVAAVNAAMNWAPVGEEVKVTGGQEFKNVLQDIKENEIVTDKIAIGEDITVERAEVIVEIDHPDWKDLTFILKSPDGTESTLMHYIPDDVYGIGETYTVHPGSSYWAFTSTQHWGESSLGEWTLEVRDQNRNLIEGNWKAWRLNLYGAEPTVNVKATQPDATESGIEGEFTISRTGNTKNPLTVNYTVGGTATKDTDYQPLTGSVVIPAGQSSALVTVKPIFDHPLNEGDETVKLTLTSGSDDNFYNLGRNLTDTVTIANSTVPLDNWNAKFINRTADNVADRTTYDFSEPVALRNLGYQSNNGKFGLKVDWGSNSPNAPEVQADNFAMQTWTRKNFEAGKLYKIVTQSDDGVWFRLKNAKTREWVGDSVVLEDDGADWRDRNVSDTPRTIFFKVPVTGEYDFYVDYYDKDAEAAIDFTVEEAQYFAEDVDPFSEWHSTIYWWDRKSGERPAGDFFANGGDPSNLIGLVNLGSDIRADGKKGISVDWGDGPALGKESLPDNNFAIRSFTEENLEAGRQYQMRVKADDGFQLLAKNKATNEVVYITPKNVWLPTTSGEEQVINFTVPRNGVYEIYFDTYEERGNASFDLSWEVVN